VRAVALAATLAAVIGLGAGARERSPWATHRPSDARVTDTFEHPKLTESSNFAASRRQPGILWTLNDSGNEPLLFATDTLGRDGRGSELSDSPERLDPDGKTLAEPIGTLPIDARDLGTLVTDAALSPSGDVVAVRTYLAIFLFRLTPDRTLRALGLRCDTAGLQLQGEGIS
jgi:hypothetical protein